MATFSKASDNEVEENARNCLSKLSILFANKCCVNRSCRAISIKPLKRVAKFAEYQAKSFKVLFRAYGVMKTKSMC